MVRRRERRGESAFGNLFSTLGDMVFSGLFAKLEYETDELMDRVEERAHVIESRLMQRAAAGIVLGVGAAFLIVAGLLYLISIGLSMQVSFVIAGALLLLIGLFVRTR